MTLKIRNNNKANRTVSTRSKRSVTQSTQQSIQIPTNLNIRTLWFTKDQSVLPPSWRTTLRYYEQVTFTAVTTPQSYIYRANAPYDPNQTGTGAQPVGYDNMATFYDTLFCVGSRISINVINQSTPVLQLALNPTPTSTTLTNFNDAKIYPLGRSIDIDGITRGSKSYKTISSSVAVLDYYNEDYDRDYSSNFTAVPGRQLYWSINMQTADQASAISCILQITVMYDVVFSSPKLVGLS